jgi:hypothetical protein
VDKEGRVSLAERGYPLVQLPLQALWDLMERGQGYTARVLRDGQVMDVTGVANASRWVDGAGRFFLVSSSSHLAHVGTLCGIWCTGR